MHNESNIPEGMGETAREASLVGSYSGSLLL